MSDQVTKDAPTLLVVDDEVALLLHGRAEYGFSSAGAVAGCHILTDEPLPGRTFPMPPKGDPLGQGQKYFRKLPILAYYGTAECPCVGG